MACAPHRVAVNVANVTLANGNFMRGVSIGVGSPVQNFAFLPNARLNNSYVYDSNGFCANQSTAWCTTNRGGQYDQSASTSSTVEPNLSAAGGSFGDSVYTSAPEWARDDLVLQDNTTLRGFPLAIARQDTSGPYNSQMHIRLNTNSTILNALMNTGQIISRTWSMFWGLTGTVADQQSNGTFIFGGFDAAKVQGKNYTHALNFDDPSCSTGMLVRLSDLRMVYPNGTSVSLFGASQSTALNACIDPGFTNVINLPFEYYNAFEEICQCEDIGRSFGVNFYGMLYSSDLPSFVGQLVIEIDDSIDITIDNSQLLQPDMTISDDGKLVANSTTNELLINSIQDVNINDLPVLGRQFLSAAMLMTNLDAQTFTLWQALESPDQSLVAVDRDGVLIRSLCSAADNSSGTTTSATPTDSGGKAAPTPPTLTPTLKPPIAAIAGGTVAGVIGMVSIIAAIWFIVRHRKIAAAKHSAPTLPQDVRYHFATSDVQVSSRDAKLSNTQSKPPVLTHTSPVEMESMRKVAELPAS